MRIDLKKDRADLYRPGVTDLVEVRVPPMRYLAADGHGDPNTSATYADAVAALYTVGYAVRAALTERTGDVMVVGPLEGLWSSADPSSFVHRRKDDPCPPARRGHALTRGDLQRAAPRDLPRGSAARRPDRLRTVLRQPVRQRDDIPHA